MNEAKALIVRLVRAHYERAQEHYVQANVERAADNASAKVWDEMHPDDGVGGMSQNPYNWRLDQVDERVEQASIALAKAKDAYDFAVDTFIKGGEDAK